MYSGKMLFEWQSGKVYRYGEFWNKYLEFDFEGQFGDSAGKIKITSPNHPRSRIADSSK